jgi:cytoskeletal protein CcmA (bactofilin family)
MGDAAPRARGGEDLANIGKSITIKGDLTGNEDLVIDGNVEGRIDLPNNQLTIGPEGKIKADIHAKAAIVVGHVTGNVSATERIEVQASGIVDGDVRAPRLVVQEGAVLNGAVEMSDTKRQAPAEPVKKAAMGGDGLP